MANGLKAIRKRAGLTQAQAAELMGLSKSGYVKIEDGLRRLSARHIRAAMKAFAVGEREILGTGHGAKEPKPVARNTSYARTLTPIEAQAIARACVMFLEENADGGLALEWLEALIEDVLARGNAADFQNLEILRAKVRTVSHIARAGLLSRNPTGS